MGALDASKPLIVRYILRATTELNIIAPQHLVKSSMLQFRNDGFGSE